MLCAHQAEPAHPMAVQDEPDDVADEDTEMLPGKTVVS